MGEIRGLGLFWGLELVKNRKSRAPLVPFNASGEAAAPINQLSKAALEKGLYLFSHWNVVIVAPPLTISSDELEQGIEILDSVLEIADRHST